VKKMKRIRIGADALAATNTSWKEPTIRFTHAAENKEVVLVINYPWEIEYLRKALTEIADYWKKQVAQL
jgi:hypothetical protein